MYQKLQNEYENIKLSKNDWTYKHYEQEKANLES